MTEDYDIAIVGAGMAGASLAAELAPHARVVVLEAEEQPGYHTTGRSAAFWDECYGGPDIVPLTVASGPFLRALGILSPRGGLYLGRDSDAAELDAFMDRFARSGVEIHRLHRDGVAALIPGLKPQWTGGVSEPASADIDVAALHQHYLTQARHGGAVLHTRARLSAAEREGGRWRLACERGQELIAGVLVDAAGAWADPVATLAGAQPLGIAPKLRTVAQLRTAPAPPATLPLTLDIRGSFYFKPESGRLWLSPHDESASEPCDAAPEELAVAEAIDRFEAVVDWKIEAVERRWAGLRSFAPDRLPVYGFDARRDGFFWFAGQGGFGIQTAPAAARLAAQTILGLPRDTMTAALDAALYAPDRFG
ncbi:MAG: FAD-dependent oxidoreductase [Novosphingobium sp.]|nr:FAD-dependent oxidoreductase [Novosphingobium sp.]